MTDIMRATTAADFLSAIPVMLGYQPKNSIVCVAFRGRRTGEVIRLDLPPQRRSNQKAVASTIIGMLSRITGITGASMIIYTDETFESENGIPQLDLGRMLPARIHGAGFHLPDALCVAGDGWASYFDTGYPRAGHPLGLIAASEIASRLSDHRVLDDLSDEAALPERDPLIAERLEYLLDGFEHLTDEAMMVLDRLEEMMDLDAASCSCTIAEYPTPPLEVSAWMLSMAQRPSDRDVMSITVAFGCEFGEAMLESNARYHQLQADTGGTMDEVVQREIDAGRVDVDDVNLLAGHGTRRPNVPRVQGTIDLLKQLIANIPDRYRPGPLCMLSWLQWSLGRGSAAGAASDMALAIDPKHSMALLLNAMLSAGMLPEWAFSGSEV
ncbi:DUF4192 family protein [Salinibacterium sp.]|uniref:DUF4192 family protein n=1 Tax=Salinibacterium sp. TaxID=1915057 RepID=UPI00286BD1E9|nr:DUF4192 family protein [Salinibacterium sp.]